ncbi:CotH kinase family protein [Endozoicomonas atrinae]|uniref:CotH kinase family protein n=1 Tax=Endozoicomonas atrinae TaxID=1333660 RepID=UPI003AFF6EC6
MKLRLDRQAHVVSKREKRFIWIGILCIAILLIPSLDVAKTLLIQGGYRSLHTNPQDRILQLVRDVRDAPAKLLNAERDIPSLRLDIKYKEWQKLVDDRQAALADGLIPDSRQYAEGDLYFQQSKYDTDLRLQGDLLDHVKGQDRWSLRLELKKGKAIYSTSRFALLSSNVRSHQGPELFRQTMNIAGFDILSPQHFPVNVIVNGDDWGVMLLEQAFGQDLLATNNRTEGLVVRLDLLDERINSQGQRLREFKPRAIQGKKISKKEELARQQQIALSLISDFINGKRAASDVFDVEKLGQYLATVDIWGAWHALTWNNWRWYYNPHTARLEPIQSDVVVSPAKHTWLMKQPSKYSLISATMLSDPKVAASYELALQHLKNQIDTDYLLNKLEDVQESFSRMLHSSVPFLGNYDFQLMKAQVDCLGTDYQVLPCSGFRELSSDLHTPMQAMSSLFQSVDDIDPLSFIPRPELSPHLKKYPFIKQRDNFWEIQSGTWTIDDYLVTPDNWKVIIQPDTRLEFSEGAGLMVFGELEVNGTQKNPVTLNKRPNGGHWSGLAVMGTTQRRDSKVRHLIASHAKSPKLGFWQPRGAVYFVNSIVSVNHLSINNNASEDALNIINSDIEISNLEIHNALSDGFDCDFCSGTVKHSRFFNIGLVSGGDAIDTSGSVFQVQHSFFDGVSDKAISAGENSRLTIENSTITNSNIAVVAKDRSEVVANNLKLVNIKEFSLMSYMKKSIFGPARLSANDINCLNFSCKSKSLVEKGSVLLLDGIEINSKDVNVKALYKGIMKSDKPK